MNKSYTTTVYDLMSLKAFIKGALDAAKGFDSRTDYINGFTAGLQMIADRANSYDRQAAEDYHREEEALEQQWREEPEDD